MRGCLSAPTSLPAHQRASSGRQVAAAFAADFVAPSAHCTIPERGNPSVHVQRESCRTKSPYLTRDLSIGNTTPRTLKDNAPLPLPCKPRFNATAESPKSFRDIFMFREWPGGNDCRRPKSLPEPDNGIEPRSAEPQPSSIPLDVSIS